MVSDEMVEKARLAGMAEWSATYDPVHVEFDLRAALEAVLPAALAAERERCASINDGLRYSADTAFDERVRRFRKGERNLELAAATAAGMSHASRKAAAAIRALGDQQ